MAQQQSEPQQSNTAVVRTAVSDSSDSAISASRPTAAAALPVVAKPHSPGKAFLLSLFPGAGQVYNRQYLKVPIFYGIGAGLGYWCHSSYKKMENFREEYLNRVNGGEPRLEGYTTYPNESIYNLYTSNNQNFQLSIVLIVVLYAANLVDAYVYGHLFEFTIDDDLSLALSPSVLPSAASPLGYAPTMGLSLKF